MKTEKVYHIEKCASTDPHRFVINGVYLDKEDKSLIATDGRTLAVVPCKVDSEETSQIIPSKTYQAIRKARPLKNQQYLEAECNGNITFEDRDGNQVKGSPIDGVFPNWKQVVPDFKDKKTHTLLFNPQLLQQIAGAIGSPGEIKLEFELEADGATLTPLKVTGKFKKAFGVLMPIRHIIQKDDTLNS